MHRGAVLDSPAPVAAPIGFLERCQPLAALAAPAIAPFLASRFVCFLAAYLSTLTLLPAMTAVQPQASDNIFIGWTNRFDGGWYSGIATTGYSYVPGQQSSVAFFPLYPMLVRGVSALGPTPIVSSLLINQAAFFGAMVYFHVLACRRMSRADADRALWLLAIFPSSFFFSAMYSESLFLFLCVASFAHLDRRQWVWAVAFAALASSCRMIGCLLYVAITMEWMKDAGWTIRRSLDARSWRNLAARAVEDWRRLLLIQLSLAGLAAFMAYLYFEFGDPILFQRIHAAWGRQFVWPWQSIGTSLSTLLRSDLAAGVTRRGNPIDFANAINCFCLLGGLAVSVGVWRRFGETYGVFCLASLAIPGATGLMSMSRLVLAIFPLFLWLGVVLRAPAAERAVFAVFASLLAVLTALVACGIFVA